MPKAPKLKSRKLPPCGPVDVAAVWKRLEAGVGALAPGLVGNLARGATDKALTAFEKAIGRKLPPEVRESFRAHDGQRGEWWDEDAVFYSLGLCSVKQARETWAMWDGLGCEPDDDLNTFAREHGSSTPKNAIRLGYTNPNWIPLVDTGGSCAIGVDLDPGPTGLSSQVINFGRDEEQKKVLAWSWGWFLTDLAEELERGNFRYESDDRHGLMLIDPDPPHGNFCNVFSAWSKAKTAGRRPFDPLSAEALAPLRADTNVKQLARVIADKCDFGSLPILADALEEAGCTDKRLLGHCRKPGEHGCGCWAVNLLLGGAPEFVAPA